MEKTSFSTLPNGYRYDPLACKTIEELCWVCLHELSMHADGEYQHKKKALIEFRDFAVKYGDEFVKHYAHTTYLKATVQREFKSK